jgi:hypothetical protein
LAHSCSVIRASAILHETPRRPAHARILAGAQAAHQQGIVEDVFPYPQYIRFCNQHTSAPAVTPPPFMETLENE